MKSTDADLEILRYEANKRLAKAMAAEADTRDLAPKHKSRKAILTELVYAEAVAAEFGQ